MNSPMMHTARDPKHKPTQAGQSSSSHSQTEVTVTGINSQTPQRGSSSPSLPHGTKRKLSSDRNMPTPGGDDIESQLIGPGVPSSINIGLEGPALKRRGSIAETQRVGQTSIFDRRHSIDAHARPTSGGPQWWGGDRRDSSSSMFTSPPVSYGSPTYSADSSHGHPPGTAPFAWHSTQPPDQSSTVQGDGESSSGRTFDPSSVPPLAMVPPAPFNAERRMSVPTNLPSTMSGNSTVSRVLRSRSRPPSGGRRGSETGAGDSVAPQTGAEPESGGPASASSSAVASLAGTKDGLTPYSRSPELRVSHKLAERKRRKEMKELFDELRDQLPADRGMKASKWEILSKAIDFIMQLKQGHQDMSRDIDMLRHELESIRGGVPPFGSGGPHPGMYAPGPPGVVPYPPHPPAGHALPPHQPPQVPNHQSAPPPQSDSRPGSSQNAFNASPAPQGGGSGGTTGQKPDTSSA
ncbi:hypothetical protein BC826DRAFT_984224 [Russula brevipes]|nr:hypothetical protein BC826DRAFT_984224 [Russula brevipes]